MAHSPAPWTWHHEPGAYPNLPFINDATGKEVIGFGDDTDYYPSCGQPPNPDDAALICAAPDLLEACQEALKYGYCIHGSTRAQIEAAIAKATNPIQTT